MIVVNVEYKERAGDGSRGQRASRFLRPLQQISCFPNPRASSARLLAAASYSLEQAAGRGATGATCQLLTHRLSLYALILTPGLDLKKTNVFRDQHISPGVAVCQLLTFRRHRLLVLQIVSESVTSCITNSL